ncbi:MAG: hypothetical protein M0R50_06740 [Candidatus Cloacimonetes bacterium]|jgi:hypothetical protein|nr:hypothetical protein [Candidatus Cloacimonadota bacterium]
MDVKIIDEMLGKMLILYANEQAQLNARIMELDSAMHETKDNTANVTYMISPAHQYEEPVELTAKIIRKFIWASVKYYCPVNHRFFQRNKRGFTLGKHNKRERGYRVHFVSNSCFLPHNMSKKSIYHNRLLCIYGKMINKNKS